MYKKLSFTTFIAVFLMLSSFVVMAKAPEKGHVGETKMLNVSIEFSNSFGKTVTSASGIDYHVWGLVFHENKVYIPSLWGEFPLYFFDTTVGATVRVTNKGPRQRTKILIKTNAQVLHTDGSAGFQLAPAQTKEVVVMRGETKVIDASFMIPYSPQADSGLDLFTVKILHQNEGGGPGNSEPALIMSKRGVFCPPKFKP